MRILLSSFQAIPLLAAHLKGKPSVRTTIDLGYSKTTATLNEEGVQFDGFATVPWHTLEYLAGQERKVYFVEGDEVEAITLFSETTRWVRTLAATTGAPTVLVSGKPMHRMKDTDPWADTKAKLKTIGIVKGRILDTATGLGYTAILAARMAREVVTIELDPGGLEVARLNPWSAELFTNSKIQQVIGDSFEEISSFPSAHFEAVLHDPPTTSLGGALYSEEFYRRVKRVLKFGGKFFHYCGDPNSGLGATTTQGVMKRLAQAGFKSVRREPEAFGVSCLSK